METKVNNFNRQNKPKISVEEMINLYKSGLSMLQVGQIAGISKQAVQIHFKKKGFARRCRTEISLLKENLRPDQIINRQTLVQLYTFEKRAQLKIARMLGVSQVVLRRNLEYHRIPIRRRRLKGLDGREVLSKQLLARLYVRENLSASQIARQIKYSNSWVGQLLAEYGLLKIKK